MSDRLTEGEREATRQSQVYRDSQEAIHRAARRPREVIREQEFVA